MKHIKHFEREENDYERKKREDKEDKIELLSDLLDANPLNKDHDFYIFIGRDEFKETDKGIYKKSLEIENMVKISPDENSMAAMSMMELRARVQNNSTLYHIWLPKDLEDEISGKSSDRMEPWMTDLIDKYKMKGGGDDQGKRIYKEIKDKGDYKGRREMMRKYNIGL